MALVDASSLPNVLDPDVVTGLADRLTALGNSVITTMSAVRDRWAILGSGEIFEVTGAEGAHRMLDRPLQDANDFSAALSQARIVLWDAGTMTLPHLRARRDELAARVSEVNARYEAAEMSLSLANLAYARVAGQDHESAAVTEAARARSTARAEVNAAGDAGYALRADIERFREDLEAAEQQVAAQLRNITGGTDVHGAWGEPVRVSRTFWGYVDSPYPGSSVVTRQTLAQQLATNLSDAVVQRIWWMSEAPAPAVEKWMTAHPDFASAVAFVDPTAAERLWTELSDASTAEPDTEGAAGTWVTGPLAHLLAVSPLAVGNLNGIPAKQKHLFNRAGLSGILSRDDLDDEAREQLRSLARQIDDSQFGESSRATLLSLHLDVDGSPRASVAWGDVDTADQVTTVTHGINTDLASYDDWSRSAADMKEALDDAVQPHDSAAQTAVVLFMDWDSGDMFNVWGIDRPDAGAARLEQALRGFEHVNPAATLNIGAHSLGTTMTAQAVADNPGLVQNVWFFGSAGITEETGRALEQQIAGGEVSVHATHATADSIAGMGRAEWVSAHPVDPRILSGVEQFSSDGGFVADVSRAGEQGLATDSHDAHRSERLVLTGWNVGPDGSPVPIYERIERTGYLDANSEAFLRMIAGLAERAALEPAP